MNESLCRALLRAHLSEEDVAARLQVDPKTVRRWLDGRVPYPSHRWLLASALGLDEADLWPQLASRALPPELQAIYPQREAVPHEAWLRLFGNAQERIDVLSCSGLFLATDSDVLNILSNRAAAGVKERFCLRDPDARRIGPAESPRDLRDALELFGSLRQSGDVEVRVHKQQISNEFYRSDGESLVTPGIYGVAASRRPTIHLSRKEDGNLFESYLKSYESIWTTANVA
jgi:hypothetical protein